METYTYQRPSVLPAALAPKHALGQVSGPQAHRTQARLALILATVPTGVDGTSGFTGNGIDGAEKRMDVRGVPPRGRPV